MTYCREDITPLRRILKETRATLSVMLYSLIIVFFNGPEAFWGQETFLFDSMAECEQHKPALVADAQKHHSRFNVKGGCTVALKLSDLKESVEPEPQESDDAPADTTSHH